MIENVYRSSRKITRYSCKIWTKLELSQQIFGKNPEKWKFHAKIRPVRTELLRAEMTNLIFGFLQFCERALKRAQKKTDGKDLIRNILKKNQGKFLSSITLTCGRYKNNTLFYAKPNRKSNKTSHYSATTTHKTTKSDRIFWRNFGKYIFMASGN